MLKSVTWLDTPANRINCERQPETWLSAYLRRYSWLSLSRARLSRITAYLEVKILSLPKQENLTTGEKYFGKEEKLFLRSNFSSFPQYFHYISNFKSQITYKFVKCGCSNHFFLNSANMICRGTNISKYFSESFGIRDNESRLYIVSRGGLPFIHDENGWTLSCNKHLDQPAHMYQYNLIGLRYPPEESLGHCLSKTTRCEDLLHCAEAQAYLRHRRWTCPKVHLLKFYFILFFNFDTSTRVFKRIQRYFLLKKKT